MSTIDKQNFIANGSYDVNDHMTSSAKDVFEGQVLIDRLLLYYSKFEGSRERAARYAQKLLDLGHVESLTNATTFEDSAHVYRWADANQVVNEAKNKSVEPKTNKSQVAKEQLRQVEESGKAILKISIEANNCHGAEIQVKTWT